MKRCCCCKRCSSNDIYFADIMQFAIEYSAIIIDVRSRQEFDEWHVDGSINIPLWDIKIKVPEILKNKNKCIVVYCSSGIRSKKAQRILLSMGYENVYNVCDGFYG